MTTNIERAAEVLRDDKHYKMGPHGEQFLTSEAAHSLADAGRLMPDLPAPHTVDRYPGSVCWEVCTDPSAAARRHVGVRVDHMHRIKTNITGEVTPDEAREAAYSLIAAANYAEQEQDNV